MSETIKANAPKVLTPVVITDGSGMEIGFAFLNTKDIRIPARLTEILEYVKSIDVDNADYEALLKFDKALEDKFCNLFGYDCRSLLFGIISPTTPCGGKFAAVLIVEKVMECLSDDVKKKAERVKKYVEKYSK